VKVNAVGVVAWPKLPFNVSALAKLLVPIVTSVKISTDPVVLEELPTAKFVSSATVVAPFKVTAPVPEVNVLDPETVVAPFRVTLPDPVVKVPVPTPPPGIPTWSKLPPIPRLPSIVKTGI
jgi:hypothetical protein